MSTGRFLTILSISMLALVLPSAAQRTRKPAPRSTPIPARLAVSPVVAAAKQQVANQLYNVNVFVDKMGPVAIAIENADKQATARRLKREDIDANEANKKKLIAAIRGLRQGLVALETDFRTKPQLTQYLLRIQGISSLCAQSEDNAIAGRFVASKDPLRQVANKLNDTLAVLPGTLTADSPSTANQYQPVPASMNQTRPAATQTVANTRRDVFVGMSTAEALASTWGSPNSKRTSTSANGTTEVWLYPGNKSLYFFNGKLTRIAQ